MTTTHHDWPVQLHLPGQAAAPEGPIDMMIMYVMHHAFRRDLTAFAGAACHTPVGDRETWRLLATRWALFSEQLHHHHETEDDHIWPRLRERADGAELETLAAMEAEHDQIDPLLTACGQGLDQMAERPDEDTRAALTVRLAAARDHLDRHLAHEETEAIVLIQKLLTAEEWHRLDEDELKADLTPRMAVRMVPWAGHGLADHVRERVLDGAGLPFRLVWLATHRRFARREARTFRHA